MKVEVICVGLRRIVMIKILLKGKLSEIIKTLNELREDIFDVLEEYRQDHD